MPAFTFTTDNAARKLIIPGHGFHTGDGPVALMNTGGALPAGLLPVTDYWVIVVDANTIQLASSVADALAGAALPFFDNGSGTQTLGIALPYRRPRTYAQGSQIWSADLNAIFDVLIALWAFMTGQFQTLWNNLRLSGSLIVGGQPLTFNTFNFTANAANDQLTANAHGLSTGDGPVQVSSTSGLPGGLVAFTSYWVIVIDANTLKLATSFANALAGTAIDITSIGSGIQGVFRMPTTTRAADATVTRNLVVGGTATASILAATGNISAGGNIAAAGSVSAAKYVRTVPETIVIPLFAPTVQPPFISLGGPLVPVVSGSGSGASNLFVGLPLVAGKRIVAIRARVKDNATGPTKVQVQLVSATDNAPNFVFIATSSPSSGTGAEQTVPMTGLTVDVAASTAYFVIVSTQTGLANCSVYRLEVDVIQPP